jgi:hypothetical protein
VLAGKLGAFFTSFDASTPVTGEGMTRVGVTTEYYITTRSKMSWDPNYPVVVYDGATVVTPTQIDYGIGYVTLPAAAVGTVTCDVRYLTMECLGGCHNWKVDIKADTKDTTTFTCTLNAPITFKSYTNTMMEFSGSADRYWMTVGGHDPWEIESKIAGKIVILLYLDVTTGTKRYLSGSANVTGISTSGDVSGIVESNIQFNGSGRLIYHAEG